MGVRGGGGIRRCVHACPPLRHPGGEGAAAAACGGGALQAMAAVGAERCAWGGGIVRRGPGRGERRQVAIRRLRLGRLLRLLLEGGQQAL